MFPIPCHTITLSTVPRSKA